MKATIGLVVIVSVIFGGAIMIVKYANARHDDCRQRCHPHAYELWHRGQCVCNKLKEFAP